MAIAYLMWTRSLDFVQAHAAVKAARGVAEPNAGFVCALLTFAKRHSRRGVGVELGEPSRFRLYRMVPDYTAPSAQPVETTSTCTNLDPRTAYVMQVLKPAAPAQFLTPKASLHGPQSSSSSAMSDKDGDDRLKEYKGKCIVLFTSYASNQLFEVAWRKLETQLQSQRVSYISVDGADGANVEVRNALWALSGRRTYPQVFIYGEDCVYVGGGSEVQEMLDAGSHLTVFGDHISGDGARTCETDEVGAGASGSCFVWVGSNADPHYRDAALRWAGHLAHFEGTPRAPEEFQSRESEPLRELMDEAGIRGGGSAIPVAAYDADYAAGRCPILPNPKPVLAKLAAEPERNHTGDVIAPQQRWHTALHALTFARHLSSY
mmetsp:Transcript_27966/g.71465  ORF Transcript_27966/g.71465 Transcript_27966/m.71465 type:complete len:376 (+) Transcript_27966:871-1998(+)